MGRAGLIQVASGTGQEMSPWGQGLWDRRSGPETWRSWEGQVSAFLLFLQVADNQSLSTHCWPRVVWLRNTFKWQRFHTTWPGQLWTILLAEQVGGAWAPGLARRRGHGKEMGADPGVEVVPAALLLWPSGHQLESSSDRSCNSQAQTPCPPAREYSDPGR